MKFEYKIEFSRFDDDARLELLNKEGEDGWELVHVSRTHMRQKFYFKRVKNDKAFSDSMRRVSENLTD